MTFTEQIYNKLSTLANISTDEFSIEWLGQSRSYYSSNKARGLEASNTALLKLMHKLTEQKQALAANTKHPVLLKASKEFHILTLKVAAIISKRTLTQNPTYEVVSEILFSAAKNTYKNHDPSKPLVIFI